MTLRITIGSSAGMSSNSVSRPERPEPDLLRRRRWNLGRPTSGTVLIGQPPIGLSSGSSRRGAADDQGGLHSDNARRAVGSLDPLEQQLGCDPGSLGRAEIDRGERRPGDLGEWNVVHPDERHVVGYVETRGAQRRKRADRKQVVGAENRVWALPAQK